MTHSISILRLRKLLLLILLLPSLSWAVQVIDVVDGQPAYGRISAHELTRVKVANGRIENIRGLQGELVVEPDANTGEIYIRPTNPSHTVNLFVTTDSGKTYTLLLQPQEIPATNIVIKERDRGGSGASAATDTDFRRFVRNIVRGMARDDQIAGMDLQEVGATVPLWKDTVFVLEKKYTGQDYVGEKYTLTNASGHAMVLREPQFFRKGIIAVSVETMQLASGATTDVFIVRRKMNNE
jgi:conjugal transfer pilus assembly protein TraK